MAFGLDTGPDSVVNIKVIGVGGGGNNVVNRMVHSGMQGVDFVAVNTDKQALAVSSATTKIQIGEKLTGGQGAGSNPDVGRKSAEESRSMISNSLEGTDMVFITAGMGGGTGSGSAPILADLSNVKDFLTLGVFRKPFSVEGPRRIQQSELGRGPHCGRHRQGEGDPHRRRGHPSLQFRRPPPSAPGRGGHRRDALQGGLSGHHPQRAAEARHGPEDHLCKRLRDRGRRAAPGGAVHLRPDPGYRLHQPGLRGRHRHHEERRHGRWTLWSSSPTSG